MVRPEEAGHNFDGASQYLGGYNAVRLSNGRLGSFQESTIVKPENIKAVRCEEEPQ
jgi:hypothetical protein